MSIGGFVKLWLLIPALGAMTSGNRVYIKRHVRHMDFGPTFITDHGRMSLTECAITSTQFGSAHLFSLDVDQSDDDERGSCVSSRRTLMHPVTERETEDIDDESLIFEAYANPVYVTVGKLLSKSHWLCSKI